MDKFKFKVLKKDGYARKGLIETKRGNIKTPAFMPIATQGAVKFTPICLLYTSPSPRDPKTSRMPSSA